MEVTIELPDSIAEQLQEQWQDLPRCMLEGIALKGLIFPFDTFIQ